MKWWLPRKRAIRRGRWHDYPRSAWRLSWEFDVRDLWVGVYWNRELTGYAMYTDVYLVLIPTLPFHLQIMQICPGD